MFNLYAHGIVAMEKARFALGHQITLIPDPETWYNHQGYECVGNPWMEELFAKLQEQQDEDWSASGDSYSPREYAMPTLSHGPKGSRAVYENGLSRITVTESGWSAELFSHNHPKGKTLIFRVERRNCAETKIRRDDWWIRQTLNTLPPLKAKAYKAWLEVVTQEATVIQED